MTLYLFNNDAVTTLAGPIAANSTSCNLAAGTGALFPSPTTGQQFAVTFTKAGDASGLTLNEIAYCTARSGDTLTLVRAQEGTTAKAWVAGDNVENLWTAGSATSMVQKDELQRQPGNYGGTSIGSANAQTISLTPTPASLATIIGAPIRFKAGFSNTGALTLTITSVGSATVVNPDGSNLGAGQIIAGAIYEVIYNGTSFTFMGNAYALLGHTNTWAAGNTFNAGTTFNSGVTVNANLAASGSISGGSVVASSTIATVSGNITAGNARLRASLGAFGSGDLNAATLLADFTTSRNPGAGFQWDRLPVGSIIQVGLGASTTGVDAISFPIPFDTTCFFALAQESSPSGWVVGGQLNNVTMHACQSVTRTGFTLYTVTIPINGTMSFAGGIGFRYIAVGY